MFLTLVKLLGVLSFSLAKLMFLWVCSKLPLFYLCPLYPCFPQDLYYKEVLYFVNCHCYIQILWKNLSCYCQKRHRKYCKHINSCSENVQPCGLTLQLSFIPLSSYTNPSVSLILLPSYTCFDHSSLPGFHGQHAEIFLALSFHFCLVSLPQYVSLCNYPFHFVWLRL